MPKCRVDDAGGNLQAGGSAQASNRRPRGGCRASLHGRNLNSRMRRRKNSVETALESLKTEEVLDPNEVRKVPEKAGLANYRTLFLTAYPYGHESGELFRVAMVRTSGSGAGSCNVDRLANTLTTAANLGHFLDAFEVVLKANIA